MLLTLSQMAEHLKCSVRTFSNDVRKKRIPHILVGGRKRFSLEKVEAHLAAIETVQKPVRKLSQRSTKPVTKYAEMLGL